MSGLLDFYNIRFSRCVYETYSVFVQVCVSIPSLLVYGSTDKVGLLTLTGWEGGGP